MTTAISSTYPIILNLKGKIELVSCSAKIFHRNGDKTPPCGQPIETIYLNMKSFTLIFASLFSKRLSIIPMRYFGQLYSASAAKTAGGDMQSNAVF